MLTRINQASAEAVVMGTTLKLLPLLLASAG